MKPILLTDPDINRAIKFMKEENYARPEHWKEAVINWLEYWQKKTF